MTARLIEISMPAVALFSVGLGGIDLEGISSEPMHRHDNVANWLWGDGGCILWPDGGVIEL